MCALSFGRHALGTGLAVVLLAGCGGSQTAMSGAMLQGKQGLFVNSTSEGYEVLYSFQSGAGGAVPQAGLTPVDGMLYGTTTRGGAECSYDSQYGCGTVFTLSASDKIHILHRFKGTDGAFPWGPLTDVNGTLYGTTSTGGQSGYGTVFKIDVSGKVKVLYNFKGAPDDGADPRTSLLLVNDRLYGTTSTGGHFNYGTVFKITKSGKETVMLSFDGIDGGLPYAGLIDVNGTLYGTTWEGGKSGYGTVFGIRTTSYEHFVLFYNFQGSGDGALPAAPLLAVNNTLYGTTIAGGQMSLGTVFKVTASGTESVIYSFKSSPDAAEPQAGLVDLNGMLYGTTFGGGGSKNCGELGCGAVFKVSTSGKEHVVYGFNPSNYGDGALPLAPLLNLKGTLYGTTSGGLSYPPCGGGSAPFSGCGSVFRVSP